MRGDAFDVRAARLFGIELDEAGGIVDLASRFGQRLALLLREQPGEAVGLALEPVAGTWTEVSLLGPATIPVAPDKAVQVAMVPLRGGVVRGGGMVLRLYEYAQAIDMDPPRVLREWPCFVELVARAAP